MKTRKLILLITGLLLCNCTVFYGQSWFNVKDFGASGNGETTDTKAIVSAISACVKNGGGTVYFPAGRFLTGSFQLFSNVHLYLDAGSTIVGSPHVKDYFLQKDYFNKKEYFFNTPGAGDKIGIIFACGAENISISGNGSIFGNGNQFMYLDSLQYGDDLDWKYTRQGHDYMNPVYGREDGPVLWRGKYEDKAGVSLIFYDCKNISIQDIMIKEAPNWTFSFLNSERIYIHGVTIRNNMDIPNSDGINMYNVKDVTVSDCDVQAGDDAFVVSASQHVVVSNCILSSRSSGIRMGYGFTGDDTPCKGVVFNNIRIHHSNRGIGIFQRTTGDYKDILFSNIIIDTRLHSGQWWGNGEPIHISLLPGVGGKELGKIENIRFEQIIATSEAGILLYGSPEQSIRNIRFKNVHLTIKRGKFTDSYGGNFDLRPTNDISLGIFKHDIPALYANYVEKLEIENFEVVWDKGLPDFFTKAIEYEHSSGVVQDQITESKIK